ncbi:hypothetical protein Rs2_03607 [Raphanus sativus]|nr:hypothetical protein Rs2_03607 [Raphanus sativus]
MSVTAAKNNWRVSNHKYKITFIGQTKITNCDIENDDMFHSLMEFDTILSGTMQPNLLFDVLGQAMNVGDLLTIRCQDGEERKKIDFTLRDINDQRIACCLWGKFAEMMETYSEKAHKGVVVCLLRFAKLGSFKGVLQVSNAYDMSQMLINPEIKESSDLIEAFKYEESSMSIIATKEDDNQVAKKDKTIVYQSQSWNEFEDKTIAEVLKTTQGSYLDDAEASSGVLKTPTSKRTQDDLADLPDLTSASKKICSKAIKIEKISEEEMKSRKKN